MFGNTNNIISAVIGFAMLASPGLVDRLCSKDVAKLSAEAQKQAAYIMKSGDISAIRGMGISKEEMAALDPMLKSMGMQLSEKGEFSIE